MPLRLIVVNCDLYSFFATFFLNKGGIFIVEKSVENGIILIKPNAYKELISTLEYLQDLTEKSLDEIITAKEVMNTANSIKPIKATLD